MKKTQECRNKTGSILYIVSEVTSCSLVVIRSWRISELCVFWNRWTIPLRGMLAYLQVTLHAKMTTPDLQWYPRSPNVEDIPWFFMAWKTVFTASFYIAPYKQKMRKSLSQRNHKKINRLKKRNYWYVIQIRQRFQGYRCFLGIAMSLHGGHLTLRLQSL